MTTEKPFISAQELVAASRTDFTASSGNHYRIHKIDLIDLYLSGFLHIPSKATAGSPPETVSDDTKVRWHDLINTVVRLGLQSVKVVADDVEPNVDAGEIHARDIPALDRGELASAICDFSGLKLFEVGDGDASREDESAGEGDAQRADD